MHYSIPFYFVFSWLVAITLLSVKLLSIAGLLCQLWRLNLQSLVGFCLVFENWMLRFFCSWQSKKVIINFIIVSILFYEGWFILIIFTEGSGNKYFILSLTLQRQYFFLIGSGSKGIVLKFVCGSRFDLDTFDDLAVEWGTLD